MSKAPSAILSDALTSFNRAATLAFTAAQDQARKDVTHATADAREARRERDEAVNTLHASKLEEQAWKEEAGVWKAAASQAELTINHHLETIVQLREEATQWKNQCLRLEETSRQEAVSWREQFLRVERERAKLAERIEELIAEQLNGGQAQTSATPYTPLQRHSARGDLSASARSQRASAVDSRSPGLQLSKSAPSTSKATSGAGRNRPGPNLQLPTPLSENQRGARQRTTHENVLVSKPGSTSNGTHQVVIRRVQAVVEIPVKEESADREDLAPDTRISTITSNVPSTSSSAPKPARVTKTSKTTPRKAEPNKDAPRVKRKAAMKRAYVEIDDESELGDPSQESRQTDTEEYQPVSDGDDELLIVRVKKNRSERLGVKHVSQPVGSKRPLDFRSVPKAPPPSKRSRPSTSKP